ncbi:hypothetical protein B0T16DRAFT_448881 [Cercophora newfieldiana]|uniref:Small secreted protein n=1 Tax=Cercophora newfieldiana TaxID=92897 RepID=A0AA40CLI6_9PEZI|nr:hypothetical protein B0T16DRAFT_448881 [Cercophora newfieldiana]
MQYSTILISLLATAVSAAPAPVSARADVKPWVFKSFTRTCNAADTACTVSFGIDTQTGHGDIACKYTVQGAPASRAHAAASCGPFTVTSDWSGQFGDDKGFTTWAVVDTNKQIAFPSYPDSDLVNGKAVSPDRAFAPQTIWW